MGYWRSNTVQSVFKAAIMLSVLGSYCLYSALIAAGEIADLQLSHKNGVYELKILVFLDVPFENVHQVITDYLHIYRLNPSIVESEILYTRDDSVVRVKTRLNDCIMIFCREILRVEDVREPEKGDIFSRVVPHLSNIRAGTTVWRIRPMGGQTYIDYSLTVELGFFVPPLIGTHLVKRKLHKETLVTFNNIERIARINSENGQLQGAHNDIDDAN